MNVQVRSTPAKPAASRLAIADCDIHPASRTPHDLDPWLSQRWRDHAAQFGLLRRLGMEQGPAYPKSQPNASRRDAYPPEGGRQGSSPAFLAEHHLDPNNVALGILNPLGTGQGVANPDLSAALCRAVNHWQQEVWVAADRQGIEVGMVELDHRRAGECVLGYFALVPELTGQGHGRWLMAQALARAWRPEVTRLSVQTCTLDHPSALGFYRAQGFVAVARTLETFPDPRVLGLLPPDAAPQVPLLASPR